MEVQRVSNIEFARRVGCHHSMISRIRSAERLPGIDLMTRISKEFGIALEQLLRVRQDDLALAAKGKPMYHTAALLAAHAPPLKTDDLAA